MKCLSLWQPWAELVIAGDKRIETRSWFTKHRGSLVIHAAKARNDKLLRAAGWDPGELDFGALIGIVTVADCVRVEAVRGELSEDEFRFGNFEDGRYAWILETPARFVPPYPWVGKQGIFNVPEDMFL